MPSIFVLLVAMIGWEVGREAECDSFDFLHWENEIPFDRIQTGDNEVALLPSV